MIPLSLRLRNFMSYGDQPLEIDFEGLHLACLAGNNGNGKSALLDAITWALWGRSRARREDDLVRQGATEMEVEIAFAEGDGRYRVLRKRTLRSRGGTPALELHALGEGGYTSITGATIAETQERITEILKLGYETFINSSFLLQGRADEFTVKQPAQRKAVLGEILGLERYDRLAERARERSRTVGARAAQIRETLAADEGELARRGTLRDELTALVAAHEAAVQVLCGEESGLAAVQAERQRLAAEEQALERVERAGRSLQQELLTLQRRHDAAAATVREADDLLQHEETILHGVADLRRVRAVAEELGAQAGRAMQLERAAAELRRAVEREAAELRATQRSAVDEEARLATVAGQEATLRRQVEEHQLADERIATVEGERATLAGDVQGLRGEIAALEGDNTRLKAEMGPLRDRLKLLNERGAACPVCGEPMDETKRARVYEDFKGEGLAKSERVKANEARIAALLERASALEARDKSMAVTLAGLHKMAREAGRLRQLLRQAEEAVAGARLARERAAQAAAALDAGTYAEEARARLALVEQEIDAVGYDPERYDAVRRQVEDLAPMEAAAAELATARERRSAALATLADTTDDMARRGAEAREAEETAARLRLALAGLPDVEARLAAAQGAVEEQRRRVAGLDRQVVALGERVRGLDELEERLRERRSELGALERESGAYAELGRMFGKTGIQAMVIDNALPELETSANALLARMSDGAMQVQFATQAQGARGDLLETLDIKIADSQGTRPYEMFSGGEAFRVNFAIRIALSRLLAERAGAQLQMLVIDEGFGTQDGQGRERLVEAINAIAADFEKIVVITHIDELKDLFDVRLDVVKGSEGSRVTVTAV